MYIICIYIMFHVTGRICEVVHVLECVIRIDFTKIAKYGNNYCFQNNHPVTKAHCVQWKLSCALTPQCFASSLSVWAGSLYQFLCSEITQLWKYNIYIYLFGMYLQLFIQEMLYTLVAMSGLDGSTDTHVEHVHLHL